MKTAIIGGTGGMGKLVAREYSRHRDRVTISSRNLEKSQQIAEELGVYAAVSEEAIRSSDEIVLSVTLSNTPDVIDSYAELFTSDKVVYDIASIKYLRSKGTSIVDRLGQLEARTLSIHPMFSPDAAGFAGQNVLLIPTNDKSPLQEYHDFFSHSLGASIVEMENDEVHDRYMAQVLALSHLLGYISASAFTNGTLPLSEILKGAGPTLSLSVTLAEAVLSSSFDNYAAIQLENRFAATNLQNLGDSVSLFSNIIANGDTDSFRSVVMRMREYFALEDAVGMISAGQKFVQAVTASQWTLEQYSIARQAVQNMKKGGLLP